MAIPDQHHTDDLLTLPELALYLRVSERTVRRWRAERRDPPHVRAGLRVLSRRSDVDGWLAAGRVVPVRSGEMMAG